MSALSTAPSLLPTGYQLLSTGLVYPKGRQRGRVVKAPDLKSGDPGFKSRFDR